MGRGLDRFDGTQRAFLERYLKGGIFNRKSDAAKADAYKAFLDAETAAQAILDALAGQSSEHATIAAVLGAARSDRDAGKFKDALAAATRALALARAEQTAVAARGQEKQRLAALVGAVTIPAGALAAEVTDLTDRKAAITGLLAGNPPSADDLKAAAQALGALEHAAAAAEQAIADRAARKAQLDAEHTAALARLTAALATLARADTDAAHGALSAAATTLRAEIDALGAAAAGGDDTQVQTQLGNAPAIRTTLGQLETGAEAALGRVLKAAMDGTGLNDGQKDTLAALGKADPAAMAAAITVLEQFEGSLKGADISAVDLLAKTADTAAKQAAQEASAASAKTAQKAYDDSVAVATAALEAKKTASAQALQDRFACLAHRKSAAAALADPNHPEHAAAKTRDAELTAAFDASKAQKDTAAQAYEPERQKYLAAKAELAERLDELSAAQAALEAARSDAKAAEGKKKLLDAITFGPLGPDSPNALPGAVSAQIIALYGKQPALADRAAGLAAKSANPQSVAVAATAVCDHVGSNFKGGGKSFTSADYAQTYGARLIDTAAHLPPEEAAKLDAYLSSGRQFKTVSGVAPVKNRQKTGKARSDFVGAALLQDGGALDFDKARDAMLDVMFHPKSLDFPTTMQTQHMLGTLDFLEGSPEAQTLLSTVPDPTQSGALGLLGKITGKDADALGKADAQTAIVTAMLTPMYQGRVGSCFTTGGLIKQQRERPLELMENLTKMAVEGTYQPKAGDAVPAVQSVSDDENGLLRSLEYTTASATARLANSQERGQLEACVGRGVDLLGDEFKSKKREGLKAVLKTAISDAFDFVYDPTVEGTGSDGNSTHGSFLLVRKSTKATVTDQAGFADALEEVIMGAVSKKDTKFLVSRKDVADAARSPKFLNAVRVNGKLPWELESGGLEHQAAQVLEGGTKKLDALSPKADAATMDVAERTKDVLGDILGRFGGSPDKCVSVGTIGKFNHAFNFLPDHPSLEPFKSGDPGEVKAKVQALMIDKGAAAASAAMPLERVTYLFDREMEALAKRSDGAAKTEIETVWASNRPTAAMTPAQFEAHVKAATAAWEDRTAEIEADAWRARQVKAGETVSDAAYDAEKAKRKDSAASSRAQDSANRLRDDLGLPEIVLADTNWGDPAERNYFALAPDPLTGLPKMYLKSDPPGTLEDLPDADEWLASSWRTSV